MHKFKKKILLIKNTSVFNPILDMTFCDKFNYILELKIFSFLGLLYVIVNHHYLSPKILVLKDFALVKKKRERNNLLSEIHSF